MNLIILLKVFFTHWIQETVEFTIKGFAFVANLAHKRITDLLRIAWKTPSRTPLLC